MSDGNCKCERCGTQEYIPTHQYVKLVDRQYYICKTCYEEVQGWIRRRSSLRISKYVPIG